MEGFSHAIDLFFFTISGTFGIEEVRKFRGTYFSSSLMSMLKFISTFY